MSQNPFITLIGPGVMAEAIIAGIIREGVTSADHITAGGPRLERGEELKTLYGIQFNQDIAAAVRQADVVILTIKPQRNQQVFRNLRGVIPPEALLISIVAGTSITMLAKGLEHAHIVRAMPNTPAQIGQGISVWTASPAVTDEQISLSRNIFTALGKDIYVEEESYLDMATALSGTGPAYVFLFMEALIDSGVHLGFPRRIAEELVIQTLRGSVEYYAEKKDHPAHLRNEVTSPGGTSAAALYYLEKAGLRTAISRAVWAAFERSQELGEGKSTHSPES